MAATMATTPATMPRRAVLGMAHPHQREDEQNRGNQVNRLNDGVHVHDLPGSRFLNILSIRSVSRKPLTMFVIEATTATVPRIVVKLGLLAAGQHDRPDHGDGRNGVGQRHQRRVQQPRDVADHQQPGERGQHEHEQERQKVRPSRASAAAVGARGQQASVNQATWFDLSFLRRVRDHAIALRT